MENTDLKKWKTISSEYLYKDNWLTARKDCVELPSGVRILSYYILEYPEWVCTIAITKEKKFIFVRQYRHGLQEIRYELCAGVCDPEDSSPLEAAKRELLEETGYGNGKWEKIMVVSANASSMTNHTHCFVATDVEKISEPHQEETEDLRIHILSLDEVRELMHNDEIKQATQIAPLWKYFAENGMI
ncbi:MAG: NUDIX hydrolase [Parabacteroides sp.]|nr:NUDIX hydrolase [Parabacteroides sp.]